MGKIKETVTLRSKDIDKYLVESKEMLLSIEKLEEELKFTRKNLKATKESLKTKQNWFMHQKGF